MGLGGGAGLGITIYVPISTEGSGTPTTRPKTGYPAKGLWGGMSDSVLCFSIIQTTKERDVAPW